MKTFNFLGIALMSVLFLAACDDDLLPEDVNSRFRNNDGQVEKPFKANFFTKRDYSNEGDGFCKEDPFIEFNYQVGEGNATHLGRMSTVIEFCGAGFDYKNGKGVFVAANGDELYFDVPSEGEIGHILPIEHELYEVQFQDPFTFTGGTGRFEGASGGGMTNSFVDLFDDEGEFIPEHQTDHEWIGTLILPK